MWLNQNQALNLMKKKSFAINTELCLIVSFQFQKYRVREVTVIIINPRCTQTWITQSAGAVKYPDCNSAEGVRPPIKRVYCL